MKNIMVFTSLFPNSMTPELGSFIKKRIAPYKFKKKRSIIVVAPVPYFPPIKIFPKYCQYSHIPVKEKIEDLTIYHPRYLLIPKISMPFHGFLIYLFCIPLIKRLHKKHNFHIIDSHFVYPDGMAAGLLAKKFMLPFIVSARGSDIAQFINYSLIRPQILKTLIRADSIISVSQGLKDIMINHGISSNTINVIPNGIDPGKFYQKDRINACNNLGIDSSHPIVLSVGSLIPIKGHYLTIKAVYNLLKKFPNLHLYIIGKGPEKKNLENLIKELKLEQNIHLMGQIPNDRLLDWYNAANVFCLSSAREGWPNVITEALCCGTPCVGTKVSGIPELIVHEKNGLLVERTITDISKGLETALKTNWNKKQISQAMSSRTWEKVADETDKIIMDAIDQYTIRNNMNSNNINGK